MSQRVPRPLRLLNQSTLPVGPHGVVKSRTSPLVAAYKPCGLPYFAKSQLSGCNIPDNGSNGSVSDYGGSASRLFSASPQSLPPVSPADVSDSLLTRLTDLLSPGCGRPRIALPLIHPALTRYASADQLNSITAQRKGTTLVACCPQEFMFLRNCHRLNLVRYVYRVLCRLPPCVSVRVRQSIQQVEVLKEASGRVFKNPYVRQFAEERNSGEFGGNESGILLGGFLPPCAQPQPLLSGGFYSIKDASLLRHGTVTGYLSAVHMPSDMHCAIEQQERLKKLFLVPPTAQLSSGPIMTSQLQEERNCNVCRRMSLQGGDVLEAHPWLSDDCRLRVSLDVRATCPGRPVSQLGEDKGRTVSRLIGKPFRLDFRLVKLNETCELGLYEVSTNDTSDEEIKAVFAAANLYVVNDYVNDRSLAEAMTNVTQDLHCVPPSKLANLPLAVQHSLRKGSPEELVAGPLLLHSLPEHSMDEPTQTGTEVATQLQNHESRGLYGHRHRLLLEALARVDGGSYTRVVQLVFGSGLECAAVHFPDPSHEPTVDGVQHLLQRMEGDELTEAHRRSVADRLLYTSYGTSSDCETYSTLLLPQHGKEKEGNVLNKGMGAILPGKDELVTAWSSGRLTGFRSEEVSELVCVYCGASGHVWSVCPQGPPLFPGTAKSDDSSCEKVNKNNLMSLTAASLSNESAVITTLDEVVDAIAAGNDSPHGDAGIVSIPNVAPTQEFNPHAWRRNEQRPKLHRSRARCAYCSGKHHISQCPKLPGGDSVDGEVPCDDQTVRIDREQIRANAESLFCIKCGEYGHLYTKCTRIPEGLHTAVNCPICLLSLRKVHHSPSQCPRRVTAPQDYSSSGLPMRLLRNGSDGERHKKMSGYVKKRGGKGSAVLLSDSFLSQKGR